MLEFCLVLPIYLLIFGGTFLIFDITMAKLHLQESNRNLAWLQNDRYNNAEQLINKELYKRATAFYDTRNKLENNFSQYAGNVWSFGPETTTTDSDGNEIKEYKWGNRISDVFKDETVELKVNNGWADNLGLSGILDNDYMALYSGNMFLKMDKLSSVYIGAVGVSSVLFPLGRDVLPLYKSAYNLTRAFARDDKGNQIEEAAAANGEMLIMRKSGADQRADVRNVNKLFWTNIIFRSWPSNGTLGDIRLFLGL